MVQQQSLGEVAVATDAMNMSRHHFANNHATQILNLWLYIILATMPALSQAVLIPDDRADIMAHSYQGGGVTAQGPAVLVRKGNDTSFSVAGSYYVDNVSSASIDVEAQASKYSEIRTETGLSIDYLVYDTLVSVGVTNSDEPDYISNSVNLDMSQEFFGGMSKLGIGYTNANDTVKRVDTDFEQDVDRYHYRIGWTQILLPKWITSFNYEAITDKGYLNNPYRAARVLGAYVPEVYPGTRTSEAYSLTSINYFDHRGAFKFYTRYFTDTWSISATTFDFGYSKKFGSRHLFEMNYRTYSQTAASFYSDNFSEEFDYMARDKELSTFDSDTYKFKYTFELFEKGNGFFSKGVFSTSIAFITYNYADFTHYQTGDAYSYDATVTQLLLSLWF